MKTRSRITKLITIAMAVAAIAVIGSSLAAGRAGAAGRSELNDIYVFRSIIGIIPGQRFRVTVGNTSTRPGSAWYRVADTCDWNGVPLYESEWIQVPPEEFRSSGVSREDLNTEGEPVTGRVQMLVKIVIEAPSGSEPEDFPVSLEVINEETGATSGVGAAVILRKSSN